jgi:hypothetical protein
MSNWELMPDQRLSWKSSARFNFDLIPRCSSTLGEDRQTETLQDGGTVYHDLVIQLHPLPLPVPADLFLENRMLQGNLKFNLKRTTSLAAIGLFSNQLNSPYYEFALIKVISLLSMKLAVLLGFVPCSLVENDRRCSGDY